jgi:xanthine dehydrogenase accessory factor
MKHWLETRQVFDRLDDLIGRGVPAALATVVRVRGSAYRHEGAKLLVAADGSYLGNVSGGCLEFDVREVAAGVIASRRADRRTYCSTTDEIRAWDLGVGCEGEVDVFVEPVVGTRHRERALLAANRRFACCTMLTPDGNDRTGLRWIVDPDDPDDAASTDVAAAARQLLATGASGLVPLGAHEVFVDVLVPPPVLAIVGAGDDARPLARFAVELGFRVMVLDRRPALLTEDRFPGCTVVDSDPDALPLHLPRPGETFAVVMTHQFADDARYLAPLASLPLRYLGVLGPRQRTERLIDTMALADEAAERLHGPVGLDIGTDGAEQVALSVLAEIMAVRSGRVPQSLRDRMRPMHAATG